MSSTYSQVVKRRSEMREKIRMIMEALDRPLQISEIATHPAAAGMKIQTLGLFLRHMKGIKFNKKDKTWVLDKEETKFKPAARRPYKKQEDKHDRPATFGNAHFTIKANGDLYLTIGDTSLPVGFE